MKFGLDSEVIAGIQSIFQKHAAIEKAILYGSRAKGNYREGSDIDITLIGEDISSSNTLYPVLDELDDLLLPYTFDISIFNKIDNPELIDHINRVGKVFYEKSE